MKIALASVLAAVGLVVNHSLVKLVLRFVFDFNRLSKALTP